MLARPDLSDDAIIDCLHDRFGREVSQVAFLSGNVVEMAHSSYLTFMAARES